MSAIFGIINKGGFRICERMANRMQESLLHRAVDGKNMYSERNIIFGHHKLIVHRKQAIEQLPIAVNQLMITCDARIDNIPELTNEINPGMSGPITDSQIILKAYEKWGTECVNHLEGEFTFAIWDKINNKFFGAADHIGFRTFYYYENDEIFAFASEIKAIESIKTDHPEFNQEIFFDHFTNTPHPVTYDKNIHVLPSAHYLQLDKGKLTCKQFWFAKKTNRYKFKHNREWYPVIREIVTSKIRCQVDTDHPVGILLSGGLDSSFVTAIACKLLEDQNKKLHAFCSVLPDNYIGRDKDERFYIEKLKLQFANLEVHYISIPDHTGPYSDLENTFIATESPPNIFHYVESCLFEAAKQSGVRTLLSGFGGDMTISYTGNGAIFHYIRHFKFRKAYTLFRKKYSAHSSSLNSKIKLEILAYSRLYRKVRDVLKKSDYSYLPLGREYKKRIIDLGRYPSKKEDLEKRLNSGVTGSLLLRTRNHSNAFQLEFLSPLLCKSLCELFFDIPHEQLLLNGIKRSLIRQTMKGIVAEEISNRTDKMPFSPDHNKRISLLDPEFAIPLFKNKGPIEKATGVDLRLLHESITEMNRLETKTEWQINKKLFYIPLTVIAIEFYRWLEKKWA